MLFLIRHISSPCTILLTLCRYRLVCQNLSYIMKPKQGSKCSLASTKLGRSVTSTILDGISLLMHPKMTLPLLEAIPKISKTSGRNQVPKTGKRRWCSYPHYIDQKIEAWRGVTCWLVHGQLLPVLLSPNIRLSPPQPRLFGSSVSAFSSSSGILWFVF